MHVSLSGWTLQICLIDEIVRCSENESRLALHQYIWKELQFIFADDSSGDSLLKFRYQGDMSNGTVVPLSAYLLLFIERTKHITSRGKGKRILLEISKLENNTYWKHLTYLRTRIRCTNWKRVSLPVTVASQLLTSGSRSLDLKVTCKGCGRLVRLVLSKASNEKHKVSKDRPGSRNVQCKFHKKRRKAKNKRRGAPVLVLSTRQRV